MPSLPVPDPDPLGSVPIIIVWSRIRIILLFTQKDLFNSFIEVNKFVKEKNTIHENIQINVLSIFVFLTQKLEFFLSYLVQGYNSEPHSQFPILNLKIQISDCSISEQSDLLVKP